MLAEIENDKQDPFNSTSPEQDLSGFIVLSYNKQIFTFISSILVFKYRLLAHKMNEVPPNYVSPNNYSFSHQENKGFLWKLFLEQEGVPTYFQRFFREEL